MQNDQEQKAELFAFEQAQERAARINVINTYIIRAINMCVDAGILHTVQRSVAVVTAKGAVNCGLINVTEEELREQFIQLSYTNLVHESLEYEDVFNGVIGRAEVIH